MALEAPRGRVAPEFGVTPAETQAAVVAVAAGSRCAAVTLTDVVAFLRWGHGEGLGCRWCRISPSGLAGASPWLCGRMSASRCWRSLRHAASYRGCRRGLAAAFRGRPSGAWILALEPLWGPSVLSGQEFPFGTRAGLSVALRAIFRLCPFSSVLRGFVFGPSLTGASCSLWLLLFAFSRETKFLPGARFFLFSRETKFCRAGA